MAAIAGNGHHVGILRRHSWATGWQFAEEERVNDQETMDDVRSSGRRRDAVRRMSGEHDVAVTSRIRGAAPPAASEAPPASEAPGSAAPSAAPGARCLPSRPATRSWTRRSAPTSRSTASESRSRRNGSVAKAPTSTPPSRTSRRRQASTSCRRASPRSTRWCCARASKAARRPTWRCWHSHLLSSSTAIADRPTNVSKFMDPAKLNEEFPDAFGTKLLSGDGRRDLCHPVQGRRQVDHLVSDQGLRGGRVRRAHDVGRAEGARGQDRRRRQWQPVVPRHPRRRRDRLDRHRLARGRHASNGRHRQATTSGSPARSSSTHLKCALPWT